MAGGKGKRLQPLSSDKRPKQFLPLLSDKLMIDETIDRISPLFPSDSIYISSIEKYRQEVQRRPYKALIEPHGQGTSYSVLFSVLKIIQEYGDAVITMIPSDHAIKGVEYLNALSEAQERAERKSEIVLLGVEPTEANDQYGYIKSIGNRVTQFIEKPSNDYASFLIDHGCLWNTGHFTFKASVMLKAFNVYDPDSVTVMRFGMKHDGLEPLYSKMLKPMNIEKSVIEKTQRISVIPASFEWSDIGSMERLLSIWMNNEELYKDRLSEFMWGG